MFEPADANNHLLNTVLIKILFKIFPDTLFIARFPNLIAAIFFIIFSYKICSNCLNSKNGIFCYLLLLINPFLLDYFSQARGYGLALGFQMGSIYYLLKYIENATPRNIIKMLSFSLLSVLSVFVMINFFIAGICIIVFISILNNKKYPYKKPLFVSSIYIIVLAVTIYIPALQLIENHCLYYGGRTNFYQDTLLSLTQFTLYHPSMNHFVPKILNIFTIIFIGALFISFFKKQKIISSKNIITCLLFLCIIAIILQFYLFKTLYVLDRAALYFYPLIVLTLMFSINDFKNSQLSIGIGISIFILLFFGINFVKNANFYKTALNDFESHTEEILDTINQQGINDHKVYKIDFSWPFENSIQYYFYKNKYSNIDLVKNHYDRNDINDNFNFYIYLSREIQMASYWAKSEKILYYKPQISTFTEFTGEDIIVFKRN